MEGERITGRTPLGFEYIRDLPDTKDYRVQTPYFAQALEWTTEPPTKEGWYWVMVDISLYSVPMIISYPCRTLENVDKITHWLGPIPTPEQPKEK